MTTSDSRVVQQGVLIPFSYHPRIWTVHFPKSPRESGVGLGLLVGEKRTVNPPGSAFEGSNPSPATSSFLYS